MARSRIIPPLRVLCFLGMNHCFSTSTFVVQSTRSRRVPTISSTSCLNAATSDPGALDLTSEGGVLVRGSDLSAPGENTLTAGTKFVISYRGTLEPSEWSADEVVTCWLKDQQGLDDIGDKFLSNNVDEATLTNADLFTEQYVMEKLGMEKRPKSK